MSKDTDIVRLLLRHSDGSIKVLDEDHEPGDFYEHYRFIFEKGVIEIFDCYYDGEFGTIKGIAVDYAKNEDFGDFVEYVIGDEIDY